MENNEFFGPTESVGEKGGDDVLVAENLKRLSACRQNSGKSKRRPCAKRWLWRGFPSTPSAAKSTGF